MSIFGDLITNKSYQITQLLMFRPSLQKNVEAFSDVEEKLIIVGHEERAPGLGSSENSFTLMGSNCSRREEIKNLMAAVYFSRNLLTTFRASAQMCLARFEKKL